MMKIIIRADASIHIGSGHIMRCLVLAEKLRKQGHDIYFASRPQPGDLVQLVQDKGFTVYELNTPNQWEVPHNNSDYKAWLQTSWQEDAQNLLQKVDNVDLVIVDHYGIGADWELFVKKALSCKIFAIDDLLRAHQADLVLDQTLLRTSNQYQFLNPNSMILAGCDFCLLNPLFVNYRNKSLQSKPRSLSIESSKVLISMGGIDQPNATLKVLEALSSTTTKKPSVTVLLSPRAPHYKAINQFASQHKDWVLHIDFIDNMAKLMTEHNVAIGAPGTTSWERACLGIPSIIIPLAENQQEISKQLVHTGAAIKVELSEIQKRLIPSYQKMIEQWEKMHSINLSICDGLGIYRTTQAINELENGTSHSIALRVASQSDIKQVYEWQLLPQTRQYALIKKLPTWIEHEQWMKNKLTQKMDYFYIVESLLNRDKIGVVRLDKEEDELYILSIFIDPDCFNKGFAKKALNYIDLLHPEITIKVIVLEENKASQLLFVAAGYSRISSTRFIRYPLTAY